jgi:iron complex transport system substrate-binding protein
MIRPSIRAAALAATAVVVLAACGGDDTSTTAGAANASATDPAAGTSAVADDGCITDFDPSVDYFPDKVEPAHSTLWTADYEASYVVLSVPNSEFPDQPDLRYVLVRCGAPEPALTGDLDGAQLFTVPVKRTAENHNNALAMLEQLGVLGTVVGMSDSQLTLADDPYVASIIDAADDPIALGGDGDAPDFEVALGLEPDVVVLAGYGPGYTNVSDTVGRGLPAIMVSNRVEPTPLGSAEWIKFLSVFYGKEQLANVRFAEIEAAYDAAVDTVAGKLPAGFQAAYLCIEPDNGCEFVYAHGAESLNGQILETLGATNPFADGNDAPNGQEFDYEDALGRAADADFFVDYELPSAIGSVLASDARFRHFKPFQDGNYIAYVEDKYAFCRFNLYVQVDILITDIAMGMAPDLFPGRTGTCFARPPAGPSESAG